jgi:hypothetical protein
MHFDLNGAVNAANLIYQAAYQKDVASDLSKPMSEDKRPN